MHVPSDYNGILTGNLVDVASYLPGHLFTSKVIGYRVLTKATVIDIDLAYR